MTAGTPEWLIRSLGDWAFDVRQGVALVTCQSRKAREVVLAGLRARYSEKHLQTESLQDRKSVV